MTAAVRLKGRTGDEAPTDAGSRLAAGGALLVAALPVAMALANRSAPLIVSLAAITVLASVVAQAGWGSITSSLKTAARSRLGMGAMAFIVLCIASYGWSADRPQTLRALGEAVVPLVAGAAILQFLPEVAPRWTALALAVGAILAALLCIGDLSLGMPLRNALHVRARLFEYNRPVLTLLIWFWPLFAVAVASRSLAPWLAVALSTIAIWCSLSGTAMFAQAVSAAAALLASRFPRISLLAAAIAIGIVFANVFVFGEIAWRVLPGAIYEALAWTHAADRVEIWRSYGAAMLEHPWFGAGFGTSVTLGDTAIAGEVANEFRRMLAVGHPHNGYLQIGVELGIAGCLIASFLALSLLWSWRHLRGQVLWSRVGLWAMVAATMLVGHGAWQAWWIAVVFAGAAVTRTVTARELFPYGRQDVAK